MGEPRFGINKPRFYRYWVKEDDLVRFEAKVRETDLYISASAPLEKEAVRAIERHRKPIEDFNKAHPEFQKTLKAYPPTETMAPIVYDMAAAAAKVGVGPMAAIAGAIADYVGADLLKQCEEVIVENGGDIFIKVQRPLTIGIYAGDSPFTGKLALQIRPEETPLGICTSSGTVGPSLSFGTSDATVILAKTATFADACATAVGNIVKDEAAIEKAIERARDIDGIYGVVIIKGKKIGAWGNVRFAT